MGNDEIQKFRERVDELKANGYAVLDTPMQFIQPHVESIYSGDAQAATSSESYIGGHDTSVVGRYSMFDAKQSSPKPVKQQGRKSVLGYIPWGPMDNLPNQIFRYASSLPYTAAALKYLIDLTVGLGPALTYRWTRWTGGTVKTDNIPWDDAGTMLRARVQELEDARRRTGIITFPGNQPDTELEQARNDLKEWERTDVEVREFLDNNNLEHHYQQCMTDYHHVGIFFPTYGLSRGRTGGWKPKIVKVGHIPAVCARFEQMDEQWRINHVYFSELWRRDSTPNLEQKDYVEYPTLMPDNDLQHLREVVNANQHTQVRRRPLWFCAPCFQPTMATPYYPRMAWWSIFPSLIYEYASTLVYDKAVARKNATMWGKIIFINLSYLKQLYNQLGADTPEKQEEVKRKIYESVNEFLKRRENNGKTLVLESFLSGDEKTLWRSVEIVDVPQASSGAQTKDELEEISSIIFFALGVHPALIGATPGKSGSTGGTFQRELQLLKMQQISPVQRIYLRFLQNICRFDRWDSHAEWIIRQQVLTTLDRSGTGLEETQSN